MNLVYSSRIHHEIFRSIYWYNLFSNQLKNKEVRILWSRDAILKWHSRFKKGTQKWPSMQ